LKVQDFLALAQDLAAHLLDFGPDKRDIRRFSALARSTEI
jgi:hypothetical protein